MLVDWGPGLTRKHLGEQEDERIRSQGTAKIQGLIQGGGPMKPCRAPTWSWDLLPGTRCQPPAPGSVAHPDAWWTWPPHPPVKSSPIKARYPAPGYHLRATSSSGPPSDRPHRTWWLGTRQYWAAYRIADAAAIFTNCAPGVRLRYLWAARAPSVTPVKWTAMSLSTPALYPLHAMAPINDDAGIIVQHIQSVTGVGGEVFWRCIPIRCISHIEMTCN